MESGSRQQKERPGIGAASARTAVTGISRARALPLLALGWLCVGLGFIGIFLPVMPTTIFLLIALWAFARSSPRFHQWLLDHPTFGSYITDWTDHRIIPVRAKILAIVLMSLSLTWLWLMSNAPTFVVAMISVILAAVASFILTRPSRPR